MNGALAVITVNASTPENTDKVIDDCFYLCETFA
jgi:hypothetical protein